AIISTAAACWGRTDVPGPGMAGDQTLPVANGISNPMQAAPGAHHICVSADGAGGWGEGAHGQLGRHSAASAPLPLTVLFRVPPGATVASGDGFSCALAGGKVLCWGDNARGQIGNGTFGSSLAPVAVQLPFIVD